MIMCNPLGDKICKTKIRRALNINTSQCIYLGPMPFLQRGVPKIHHCKGNENEDKDEDESNDHNEDEGG